ncbi:hypothetical protein DFQ26_000182, partial [Actinomortierella ambigua]
MTGRLIFLAFAAIIFLGTFAHGYKVVLVEGCGTKHNIKNLGTDKCTTLHHAISAVSATNKNGFCYLYHTTD